jgi:beta-glucosidase 2, glycosyl-hydrolase family 116 N-term
MASRPDVRSRPPLVRVSGRALALLSALGSGAVLAALPEVASCGGTGHAAATGASAGGATGATAASTAGSGGGPDGGSSNHHPGEPIAIPAQAWSHDLTGGAYVDGAPIGGLGAGSITWRFDGAFYHDRLDLGASTQTVDPDAGFFMYQKAGAAAATTLRLDQSLGAGQGTYYALFPRGWTTPARRSPAS